MSVGRILAIGRGREPQRDASAQPDSGPPGDVAAPVPEQMDPQHRQTVEVVEVDIIEGENGEPGSSTLGTVAGTAAGAAIAGGLAMAATATAPLAAAAAAMGAVLGAVAGGAMGKEVPRGVDVDSAMEFDQPDVVAAGQEQERQDALTETVSGELSADASGGREGAPPEETHHGQRTLGEHEIGDVRSVRDK
ncbi:hypothetical protein GPECTOR_10g829 [Gonium pectorale]|uniref:Glycine zipper domain-containing protein n=1 Tax=Gonium pectorale TaxID=33097 RepID=A0A150GR31_GONPE|nr:hypothetical protein GPECTOR_10g829 [Gonium pectorale]|eukprot:KXZ52198.1 hypothetical protein GPECTOR_10g829 [Gonium pectorale]